MKSVEPQVKTLGFAADLLCVKGSGLRGWEMIALRLCPLLFVSWSCCCSGGGKKEVTAHSGIAQCYGCSEFSSFPFSLDTHRQHLVQAQGCAEGWQERMQSHKRNLEHPF